MLPPTLADIEKMAREAWETIPDELRRHTTDIAFHVEEFCDEETEEEMALESPFDLLGLYRGVPLDRKSSDHVATGIDLIFLYRRPLLDYWCETGEDLTAVVRHVMIHELGHHFGFSDEDMERIENEG